MKSLMTPLPMTLKQAECGEYDLQGWQCVMIIHACGLVRDFQSPAGPSVPFRTTKLPVVRRFFSYVEENKLVFPMKSLRGPFALDMRAVGRWPVIDVVDVIAASPFFLRLM